MLILHQRRGAELKAAPCLGLFQMQTPFSFYYFL